MLRRSLWLVVVIVATVLVVSTPLMGQSKNTHEGTFVKATNDKEFVMEDKGKEHTHTLSADAKLIGADGKDCKLTDFTKGQQIQVTTKEGDMKVATRVEAMKKK